MMNDRENEILHWIQKFDKDASLSNLPQSLSELEKAMEFESCCKNCQGMGSCPMHGYVGIPMLYPYSANGPYYTIAYRPCSRIIDEKNKKDILKRITNCGIPTRFNNATFDNFTTIKRGDKVAIAKSIAQDCASKGLSLTLMGPPGVGKTHLACAMAHYWLAKNKTAVFVPVVSLLDEIKKGFNSFSTALRIEDLLKKADFIVLDDLGAQRDNDWVTERLWELIDQRYREKRPMAITANASSREQLAIIAGERGSQIVSRLTDCDFGHYVIIEGSDYRSTKVSERINAVAM